MFSTSFSGGYNTYAQRQSAVERANKARQKSQRISDATKGKKKSRKPENKGKHRRQDAVIKGSGQAVQVAGLGRGGSASQNVVVLPAKAKNRPGAGRPKASTGSRGLGQGGGQGITSAFGTATEKEDERRRRREEERDEERTRDRRREQRDTTIRREEVRERRRERGERARQFNIEQGRLQGLETQRRQELAQQIVREQNVEQARQRAEDARQRETIARLEGIEQRIARQPAQVAPVGQQAPLIAGPLIQGPLIAEGAIVNAPRTDFSNIGNPNVNVGTDASTRRRDRDRSAGRGDRRRRPPSGSDSSSSSDGAPPPTPSPRTRRTQQGQSATQRRGRSPRAEEQFEVVEQPTTPEEEASLLGGLAQGLATGATTLGGGLVRAGGGFVGGVGGAIAEQLPPAERVGDVAGRVAVAAAGATGRAVASGAQTIAREALRPVQEEQQADSALLESVSEGESVIVEPQRPVSAIQQAIIDRQAEERRELEQRQEEEERQRRIREQRRKETQKRAEQSEQAGILADIQSGAGAVAGVVADVVGQGVRAVGEQVGGRVSLVADAIAPNIARSPDNPTITLGARRNIAGEDPAFSSEGEQAGQVLVREGEQQGAFRETYISPQDETDEQRRERAQREQLEKEEREELERQTAKAPTPAQVQADFESGTEGIFRQFGRIAQTGGDVLEDPVEAPLSPRTIQQQEDERAARQLQEKLEKPKTQRQQALASRPVAVLSGDRFLKPSTGKATKSRKVIEEEYKKQGVEVLFTNDKDGAEASLKGQGRTIYPVRSPPPERPSKKQAPRPEPEPERGAISSESESSSAEDVAELKVRERKRITDRLIAEGKTKREAQFLARMGTRYLGGESSESELSSDTEPKFRDVKKLSPQQLERTAEQLQKQQVDVDRRLQEASQREAKKDKQIMSLSQAALLLDTEQSAPSGSESDSSGGSGVGQFFGQGRVNPPRGEGSGESDESQGEYDLRRYGQDDY